MSTTLVQTVVIQVGLITNIDRPRTMSSRPVRFLIAGDRLISDALVAVAYSVNHRSKIYAAALEIEIVPGERAFPAALDLGLSHLVGQAFRGQPAQILGWAHRPDLGFSGTIAPTGDRRNWDLDATRRAEAATASAAEAAAAPAMDAADNGSDEADPLDETSEVDRIRVAPDLLVRIFLDPEAEAADPREDDNLAVLVLEHRRYRLGDRKLEPAEERALEHGGWAELRRYLKTVKKALAITKIGMYDHSGITIYPVADDDNGHAPFDSAGWDSGIIGFGYINAERWTELMGTLDPDEAVDEELAIGTGHLPVRSKRVAAALRTEIRIYDQFLRGEIYGYQILRLHAPTCRGCEQDEELDSVWGFLGDLAEVKTEALAAAASYAPVAVGA